MSRLDILFRETESLFSRSVVSREICELRNVISVSYLIIKQALARKESRGLHFTVDYPKKMEEEKNYFETIQKRKKHPKK